MLLFVIVVDVLIGSNIPDTQKDECFHYTDVSECTFKNDNNQTINREKQNENSYGTEISHLVIIQK